MLSWYGYRIMITGGKHVLCTSYIVHCTGYSVQCTVYTVHCTCTCIVQCTLYMVTICNKPK